MTRTQSDIERQPRSIEPRTSFALAFAVVLLVATVAGPAVLPVAATQDATVSADPNTPGNTSTHTATLTPDSDESGSSLNGIKMDYSVSSNPADVSNVDQSDVVRAVILHDDGTSTSVLDDLSGVKASNNGETVKFSFGGSYNLESGDSVLIEYEDVQNPDSAGNYTVEGDLNPQSVERPAEATLTIEEATSDSTSDGSSGDGSTDDTSDGGSTDDSTSDGSTDDTNSTNSTNTTWTVEAGGDGDHWINVTHPENGTNFTVDMPRTAVENETGLTALEATVTPDTSRNFSLVVSISPTGPEPPTGVEDPAYLSIREPDGYGLGTVTLRVAVDREAFDVDNASHVAIFERIGNDSVAGNDSAAGNESGVGDGWGDANATLVNETNESYVFAVTTDHPTTYVVGAKTAVYDVPNATVDDSAVKADEPVTVAGTVRNDGLLAEQTMVTLRRNGSIVAATTVTLAPNESRTVTFTDSPAPGNYSYAVSGTDAGSITVQASESVQTGEVEGEQQNVEATPDGSGETPAAQGGSPLPSPVMLLVGALLLAGLAGTAAWVRT
ncbi:hypothetical protein [Haloparvum sp. PAK95]|uniref:hypothetical protein n=1 Tax=Haloparvum sp. PAK95 TaxID=3418962 RepID=UPI003D2F1659